ncbi:MAG: 2-C-methyl-D-erythritol 2,4-cyclodiphosphate synthase [Defluviitaleaceae bacterium]|nr:2-C-methyl-D-erythritol 2,4-cyclodiphosphate synthase [Defluviitaleaceae bacterium]
MRIGLGYDSHRFCEGRELILGGVNVPHSHGLAGHSDADALIHAVIDALLGASKLGDIGRMFPDSEPAYKDISSLYLLEKTYSQLQNAGYEIVNIDATIIAEKPKLAAFITDMEINIAKCLEVDVGHVSIKAKTAEGMGFVGRCEGIEVHAVCLINKIRI